MKVTQKPHLHQDWIDSHAMGIVKALQKQGHTTYLVGGCVRDLLIGIHPKDFDIATTARPEEVQKIIYRSYVIGRRFRLVLVKRDNEQYEVATFRREMEEQSTAENEGEEAPVGDNLFGSPEQDACRRDFTINALFYDPVEDKLIDYVNALPDLEGHTIRMIGDPEKRLIEDPIRILRAIRLGHKINFTLDPSLRGAIPKCAESLSESALPRRREEFLKWLRLEDPSLAFLEAYDLGVLKAVLPTLHDFLENSDKADHFVRDLRHFHDKTLNPEEPAQLFGLFMWAFARATLFEDPEQPVKAKALLEDERLGHLMRVELGMFKGEQSLVARAMQMQSSLAKRHEFERRGERRQLSLLKVESFPMALQIAERDFTLNAADLLFWQQAYQRVLPLIQEQQKHKRKRRPPRRKRSKGRKPSGSG